MIAFKAATAWEWQIDRLIIRINFPRFWPTSGLGTIELDLD